MPKHDRNAMKDKISMGVQHPYLCLFERDDPIIPSTGALLSCHLVFVQGWVYTPIHSQDGMRVNEITHECVKTQKHKY